MRSETLSEIFRLSSFVRRARRSIVIVAIALVLLPAVVRAQDDDPLFRAMQDELSRSIDRLELQGQEKPYFVEYRVTETEGYRIAGSFGALIESVPVRERRMGVSVRVGDYAFDNTGFLSRADVISRLRGLGSGDISIENKYMALRRDFWLATDHAFKDAVEQMAGKRAYFQNRVDRDTLSDFSRESPTTRIESPVPFRFDVDVWNDRVRRLSGIVKDYPEIQTSSIKVFASIDRMYLANSEGSRVRTSTGSGMIQLSLRAQASDGRPLMRTVTIRVGSPEELPSEETIAARIRSTVKELMNLQDVPVLEETYIGPVLMVGDAAGETLKRTLLSNLSGSRQPTVEDEGFAGFVGNESELLKRIGRPALPRFLSVYDDPTVSDFHGNALAGHYAIDDQGIPARRVPIIERGIVRELLTSRRPSKDFAHSNGHARGIDDPGIAPGNLFVESSEGKSYEQLKEELMQACRDQNLEYGIILTKLGAEDRNSMGGGGISISFGGAGVDVTESAIAVRVYVDDGREEPIRGVSVSGLNMRTLKDIMAAGSDYAVYNTGARPKGTVGFSSVPIGIVTPSLLLEEAQVNPPDDKKPKPVLLTNPYFDHLSKIGNGVSKKKSTK